MLTSHLQVCLPNIRLSPSRRKKFKTNSDAIKLIKCLPFLKIRVPPGNKYIHACIILTKMLSRTSPPHPTQEITSYGILFCIYIYMCNLTITITAVMLPGCLSRPICVCVCVW